MKLNEIGGKMKLFNFMLICLIIYIGYKYIQGIQKRKLVEEIIVDNIEDEFSVKFLNEYVYDIF